MNPTVIISYIATAVAFIVGFLLLLGYVGGTFEQNLRITLGVIFIGYSIYRFLYVQSKLRDAKRIEKQELMRIEKEKLFRKNEDAS
ncbi:MAG: hypothetical protein OZ913_03860 [Ignavibacteriaceae bacterium]|jgi:hypothetical protein|nr:MAG: hypothetical protein EDM69_01005 [Chlorobiota bacterium]KXK02630.1 MAG: hypothetical protein UZ04_CHB001001926 [Chlorobi bacterium OLB4]MBV6398749.1 hypothetical protein [Ignavibacteria bacterium]MCC6885079.1 hypothetical protein [Ignavibacteriales bacterium]MCE7952130.1 hypothetical protein [Chlorobi bacterium CHB7]MDL1886313.1 hypothetical protein [Ignavibacteria bacterium CHB1]MEB2329416.1 hypothetical protein [Ignavibacteriaceae bacterium]OQY78922.1 MAG: hypothetical protein B6D4